MTRWIGFTAVLLGIMLGCATKPGGSSEVDYQTLRHRIARGKTTQAEVKALLGSPGITSQNAAGNTIWTYPRQPFDRDSQSFAGGITLYGSNETFPSPSSTNYDLIFTFDETGTVKDYSIVASEF